MELVTFFNKWLHLISIVGVLGGTAFAGLVMAPALRNEPEDSPLSKGMWRRFGLSLAVLWVIILLTGFANMGFVSPKVNAGYQMVLGIKMLLALLMFILSLLVAHPMKALVRVMQNRSLWLVMLMIIGIAILGISAHLNISRVDGSGLKDPARPGISSNTSHRNP
jgi:putative copper export protein